MKVTEQMINEAKTPKMTSEWGIDDSMLISKVNSSLLGYAREERDQGFTRHADELERQAKMILELAPKNAWRPTLLQINMIRELNEIIKTDCPKWAVVFDAFTKEIERL